jgi:hypothetical protein
MKGVDGFFDEHDRGAKHISYKDSIELSKTQKLIPSLTIAGKRVNATVGYELSLADSSFATTIDPRGTKTKVKASTTIGGYKVDASLAYNNPCCKLMWTYDEIAVGVMVNTDAITPIWSLQRRVGSGNVKLSVKYSSEGVTWVVAYSRKKMKVGVPFISRLDGGAVWLSLCLVAAYFFLKKKKEPLALTPEAEAPPVLGNLVVIAARYGSLHDVIADTPDVTEDGLRPFDVTAKLQRLVSGDRLIVSPSFKQKWLGWGSDDPWLWVHYSLNSLESCQLVHRADFLEIP